MRIPEENCPLPVSKKIRTFLHPLDHTKPMINTAHHFFNPNANYFDSRLLEIIFLSAGPSLEAVASKLFNRGPPRPTHSQPCRD